jgi:ATP-dependent exoDNAse (exonuclease V) beta subunit
VTVADADVRELVTRAGLDRTLFVEAGAGTGKTTQLVGRIEHLVLDAGVPLADIAAITFTEAAAAELQDRIRVRFERTMAETTDECVRQHCRAAVADADRAAISTLHGFARRILAEHPVAAGLPPRVEILDEVESQLAQEARWERFVDALYADPEHEELLIRAAFLDIALERRYPAHATMKDVAVVLAQSWDRLESVAQRPLCALPPLDLEPFRSAVGELEASLAHCTDSVDKLYGHLVTTVLPEMRHVADLEDPRRALQALATQHRDGWKRGSSGGRKAAWRCDPKQITDRLAAVNVAAQEVVRTSAAQVLDRLLTLVSREVLTAAEERRREGRLQFHDLLVLARRLLRTSPEARRALHQRYRRLLLDEFQDTDPIQIELAVLLASAVEGDLPAWDELPVEEGRLFFVGDPKQSIYRFRRADIALFLAARDRFAPGGTSQRLVTNFRTVPPVLDWVNALFTQLMPEEEAGAQPKYEPLVAHRPAHPELDQRPVLLGAPTADGPKRRAGDLRHAEASDVARAIDDIRAHPDRWPVGEGDGPDRRWRSARLADITILVPTRTSLPHLREALAARTIPYRLDTGTLVYSTQEVRDALAALRAIDDPGDSLSLVAALRSPLLACDDADLLAWRQAGGRWDLTAPAPDGLGPDHPVASAVASLHRLWEVRWWHGPSDLLDRLLTERQAFLLAFGQDRPAEVWRRLRFLVDQARAFEESGGSSIRAFLDWTELQGSEGARVHDPLLPETDEEAVRVMTVHGSKGLEFPITILSGMSTLHRRSNPGVSLLWDDDGLPQLRFRTTVATELHGPRADLEATMDLKEKRRLLYVACTRARDHVLIACHHNPGDDSFARWIWSCSRDVPDLWRSLDLADLDQDTAPAAAVGTAPPPAPDDDGPSWEAAREAVLAPQRRSRTMSATAIARQAGFALDQPGRDDLELDGLVDAEAGGPPARRRGRAGTAIGRAVHATLQILDLADARDVDSLALHQAELEAVPEAADTVAAMVRSALASPAVQAAVAHPSSKEVYVAAPVGDRLVEGYVDLLIETDDGLVVVDYKTDEVRSEADVDAKLAGYELQGAAYAVALEASTGLRVVECRFVFCRPSGAIERSVADLASAMERVRAHLRA